jgi:hypothetical protein
MVAVTPVRLRRRTGVLHLAFAVRRLAFGVVGLRPHKSHPTAPLYIRDMLNAERRTPNAERETCT